MSNTARARRLVLIPGLPAGLLGCCLAGVLGLGLAACSSSGAMEDLPTEPVARERALAERLEQIDPRSGEERGARYLELTLSNPTSHRVACRCAPEWHDAKGAALAGPQDWKVIDLKAGAKVRLRFAPMPAAARSWRLRFEV